MYRDSCSSLPVGTVVNSYTIHKELGTGSFSSVYMATREGSQTPVAIKVVGRESVSREKDKQRLQREMDTMADVEHTNIVRLRDYFADERNYYMVMDYCDGGNLAQYLETTGHELREPQAATIFKQIVSAVMVLHSGGVAHRDLKPENILISKIPHVMLSDFGLCGYITNEKMSTFCGSPCYAAPECLSGVEYDGSAADVWSIGVILFEMVTGEHAWSVGNMGKMMKEIMAAKYKLPKSLSMPCADLIKGMLKVKPSERITCEMIMKHPWLKLASARLPGHMDSKVAPLPPLHKTSFIAVRAQLRHQRWSRDIISPFEGKEQKREPEASPNIQLKARTKSGTSVGPLVGGCIQAQRSMQIPARSRRIVAASVHARK